MISFSDPSLVLIGIAAGWALRGSIDRAVLSIGLRIATSAIGKRKMLEGVATGIARLERKP